MAGSTLKNPGRLGIVLLLLLFLAAVTSVFLIDPSCTPEDSADGDETIVTEAATPEVTTIDSNITGDDGSAPASSGTAAGAAPAAATGPSAAAPVFISLTAVTGGGGGAGGTGGGPAPVPPAPDPGAIVGTVFGNGGPVGSISVSLFAADGSPTGIGIATAGDGTFQLTLAPGQYKLFFSDPAGAYESAWYGGYGPGTAALVTVTSNQQTAVSQTMTRSAQPGGIAGTVRGPDGKGLAEISIFAFLYQNLQCPTGSCVTIELKGTAVTDSNGEYTVNGLEEGSYKVLFSPLGTTFTLQWYREQSTHGTAKTVAVEPGKTTAGIDADLYEGGTVSGVITRNGSPASFALVDVYDDSGIIVYSGLTDAAGNYRSTRLPDGSYRVHAATHMSGAWTDEWYSNKSDFATADPVTVTRGSDTGGINIDISVETGTKIELPAGSRIESPAGSGRVAVREQPVAAEDDAEESVAVEQPEDTASGDGGTLQEVTDVALPSDEDQQDIVGYGSDDKAAVGQVEGDEAPAA